MSVHLLVIVDIDDGLLPLAGRDLALEHDVDLAERTALHLRQEEEGDDEADETSGAPDVTALAAQVDTLLRVLVNVILLTQCVWRKENLQ